MMTLSVLAAEAEVHHPLVLAPWAFPLIGACVFAFAALVTWGFRDVSNRHSDKVDAAHDDEHAEHAAHH